MNRCLNIAISHALLSNHLHALALLSHAAELADQCVSSLPSTTIDPTSPPTLDITPSSAEALQSQLRHQIYRHQALADLEKFHSNASIAASKNMASAAPLVQRLNDYPTPGVNVDLHNLVSYPPKIEPVPVKPLFLDVAWNYIEYPGRAKRAVEQTSKGVVNGVSEVEEEKPREEKKRGWFGFGR